MNGTKQTKEFLLSAVTTIQMKQDSTWDTSDMGLSFEYGKKMQYGKDLFFTPYVRLDYDRVRTDAVTYAS